MIQQALQLDLGDLVEAEVVELISNGYLICSFDGRLLRVKNSSGREIKKGRVIQLRVLRINPLEFKLI